MPIIVLGLIFGGICTVSEAAAISAFYSAIVGVFIYKTVSIKNLLDTLYETTISVAAIMILVGLSRLPPMWSFPLSCLSCLCRQ